MDRYAQMFQRLESEKQGAFVPFVTLGDPDVETSLAVVEALVAGGADALELGIPFSDPIADGPTIQKSAIRALEKGVTPRDCLAIIHRIREHHKDIPIGLLLYSNLVLAPGIDEFYRLAAEAGVDSILIADVPIREAEPFMAAAKAHGIQQILIAPPNASQATLQQIGELSSGYTYLLGRAGVTGTETAADMPASDLISKLHDVGAAKPILGFGISKPEQVKAAIEAGAAGAIAGSATVKIIEQHLDDKAMMLTRLSEFVAGMKSATNK
ncbi:tryptophan synthase subunit alpha [Bowmanella sp. Y26]|uniref:tryptophan synthase subunit alpha n=1 Tax=Bowmanella yangjiangensis TaxID=2811230 RepID=UPI001BDCC839|nr:tryptophan synthase subunit alpha [Bowmanella yangjiangensis]MBT1065266.1 tryptophan synthase subunit alpha [Bowmanella yangjiangensis]